MTSLGKLAAGAAVALAMIALPACAEPPVAARPSSDADPALWVAKDADTTVYLFGTIHVLKPGLSWFDEAVRAAFDRADEVKLEIVAPPPAEMAALIQTRGTLPAGETLTAKLPAADQPALARYMEAIGLPRPAYDRMRPWLAASYLQVQSLQKVGYDPANGPEQVIAAAAKEANKPISGLETAPEQIGFFAGLSDDAQIAMLDETLDEMPNLQTEMGKMVDQWAAGKTDLIAKELNEGVTRSPEAMKVLLTDRNKRWADWIEARMAQPGTVFIAVGAGHLAGRDSVQAELARRGVKARRVKY
jgi:uncharacterized protein